MTKVGVTNSQLRSIRIMKYATRRLAKLGAQNAYRLTGIRYEAKRLPLDDDLFIIEPQGHEHRYEQDTRPEREGFAVCCICGFTASKAHLRANRLWTEEE